MLLIAAVTAFACLGFGMLSSGNKLLAAADNAFTTKAIIEYIDEGYPDSEKFSDIMINELSRFDKSVLGDNENVISFEPQYEVGGYIEGFETKTRNKAYGDYGVIRFRYRGMTNYGMSIMILESYYSGDYPFNEGSILYIPEEYSLPLKEGRVYIAHGRFSKGYMNTDAFIVTKYENSSAPDDDFFYLPIWDVTDQLENDFYTRFETFEQFMNIVESYNVMNNYVSVEPTKDVRSATPFVMQQTYLMDDGVSRYFTKEEYDSSAKVIILSNYILMRMGKSVGDTVRLNLYTGAEDGSFAKNSFWPEGSYVESDDYTIVGVFREGSNLNNCAYIPMPLGADSWLPERSISYTVANIVLKNGSAEEYIEAIKPKLLSAMRVSVFDQGYSQTIAPILAMRETAVLLTIVSGVCCLVVLILFAYIFVAKQKDSASTMIALGTGKPRAVAYLLICVLLIAVIASAAGAAAGFRLSEKVTQAAYERAEETTTVDNRYSAIYMNNDEVDFRLTFAPEIKPLALVACGIVGTSLLLSLIISLISLKRSAPRGGRSNGSLLRRMAFSVSLAIRSIFRGGAKNVIVPLVSLVLILFIGLFARQIATSNDKINELYDNSSVYAYYTTSNGKRVDTLSLQDDDFAKLMDDVHIDEVYRSATRYMQISSYRKADVFEWKDTDEGYPVIPTGGFAFETFLNNLVNCDKVIFTESITHTPEFLFENEVYIDYLEGYSEASFKGKECICAMPATYMEQHGYELGDWVTVCVFTSNTEDIGIDDHQAKIVASFEKVSSRDNIYMPLNFAKNECYYVWRTFSRWSYPERVDVDTPKEELEHYAKVVYYCEQYNYNALAFKLKELRTLNEFKDTLSDLGYSPVGSFGRARTWLVVEDTFLNKSVVSVNRHISYMTILFIVVYILAVAIGFVLSYLLTKSRRSELAMMRSLGTGMIRTFNIFFLEQLILSLIGGAIGVGIIWLIYHEVLKLQWLGFAGYFVCYWIGVIISTIIMNRVDVIKILSAKD